MPARTPRPCRTCGVLTTNRNCRCDAHQASGWQKHQAGLSRQQRGYGSSWEKRRLRILNRDSWLCQECLRIGIVTPASAVDHKLAKANGGTDDDSNLEGICTACHAQKTAKERLNR